SSESSSDMSSSDSDSDISVMDSGSDEESLALTQYITDIGNLYATRYLQERVPIPKSSELLNLLLSTYKDNHPQIFRSYLRIYPSCFDNLVAILSEDSVFHNHSNNPQMPVDRQLAIALYRFGHYGNAASTWKVALQFGVSFGMAILVTSRVMKACCSAQFRTSALQWPDVERKEVAKEWVEENSCPAWRDGWLMVDGTLIPLTRRPGFFGNVFFDRKSNYSMNVQLISTPDLSIIDYGVGLPGSQHDATAWEQTRLPQEHDMLLNQGEWVWADSAYPLQTWCQSPYKK
ncbi:hypothetical protein M405DRAFT_696350, partial [Rhizopogon salebrosus TDB-379]